MSEPKNHHYVPQCLIKQFKNKSDSYSLYDKIRNNFYTTLSSKSTFSEPAPATIITGPCVFSTAARCCGFHPAK